MIIADHMQSNQLSKVSITTGLDKLYLVVATLWRMLATYNKDFKAVMCFVVNSHERALPDFPCLVCTHD